MKLIFEKGNTNRGLTLMPECDVPVVNVSAGFERKRDLNLPMSLKRKSADIIPKLQSAPSE